MKNTIIIFIILIFGAVMFALNPSTDRFKRALKNNLAIKMQEKKGEQTSENINAYIAGESFGEKVASKLIDANVTCDNYFLFSIGKFNENYIGFGAFGNVYLVDKKTN